MIPDKIKQKTIHIVLFMFLISNIVLVGKEFPFKKVIIILLLIITAITGYIQKNKSIEIINYFIYFSNDKILKKASGLMSLAAWIFFTSSLFVLNMGSPSLARWLILAFIIFVFSSGVLTFLDLERSGHIIITKLKPVFGGAISILYIVTSTYAASYFLQFSNMDISDSPLLEFGWKLAFFAVYFFMLLQPVTYIIFISLSNKLVGHQAWTVLGVLIVTSLLLFQVPRWTENFIVLVVDWATSSEWHTSATCGTLNISDPKEKYFGFNTDKYTVYFSNRDGKWGFEEIKCIKDGENQDSLTRVPVRAYPKRNCRIMSHSNF